MFRQKRGAVRYGATAACGAVASGGGHVLRKNHPVAGGPAQLLGVTRKSVCKWHRAWLKGGKSALVSKGAGPTSSSPTSSRCDWRSSWARMRSRTGGTISAGRVRPSLPWSPRGSTFPARAEGWPTWWNGSAGRCPLSLGQDRRGSDGCMAFARYHLHQSVAVTIADCYQPFSNTDLVSV